jgi:WD40 repeat protein
VRLLPEDWTVRLWNLATDQEVQKLEGHTGRVNPGANNYHPDDSIITHVDLDGSQNHTSRGCNRCTKSVICKFRH